MLQIKNAAEKKKTIMQTSNCISKRKKGRHFLPKASHYLSSFTFLLFCCAADVFIFLWCTLDTFHPAASAPHQVTLCSQAGGTLSLKQTFLSTPPAPKKEASRIFLKLWPLVTHTLASNHRNYQHSQPMWTDRYSCTGVQNQALGQGWWAPG